MVAFAAALGVVAGLVSALPPLPAVAAPVAAAVEEPEADAAPMEIPETESGERPKPKSTPLELPEGVKPGEETLPGEPETLPVENCDLDETLELLGWEPSEEKLCAAYPAPQSEQWGEAAPFAPADGSEIAEPAEPFDPGEAPSEEPSEQPSDDASDEPSDAPSDEPSEVPSETGDPSDDPSASLPSESVTPSQPADPGESPDPTDPSAPVDRGSSAVVERAAFVDRASQAAVISDVAAVAPVAAPQESTPGQFLSPNWVRKMTPSTPTARVNMGAAYDVNADQVVMFGGRVQEGQPSLNQTWVFTGDTWVLRPATPGGPAARILPAMAWSPELGKVVLFGGESAPGSGYFNDMWAWDGSTWAAVPQAGAVPSARAGATLAWDPVREGLVLFGGQVSGGYVNDTRLFKNGVWSVIHAGGASGAPSARYEPVMEWSYNTGAPSSQGEMVLFGGGVGSCEVMQGCVTYGDTWVLGASSWILKPPPSGMPQEYAPPVSRFGAGLAYSSSLEGLVLHGGAHATSATSYELLDDTWAWDGEKWLKATGISTPGDNGLGIMEGTSTGELILHSLSLSAGVAQTWVYDPRMPGLRIEVTGASGGTEDAPIFDVGDLAKVRITALNAGSQPITGLGVVSALEDTVLATGSLLYWFNPSPDPDPDPEDLPPPLLPCLAQLTACGSVGSLAVSLAQGEIPAHQSRTLEYVATLAGASRGCRVVTIPAVATSLLAGSAEVSKQLTVCGGGLGTEDWWTYDVTDLGGGATGEVNVANGNLVVKQTDSTPVLSHGQLALSLGRAYNSQSVTGGNSPLGAGWQFDMGQTGEGAGGFGIGGLKIPPLQSVLQPLSTTYVDRDGTRHVFKLRSLAATLGSTSLGVNLTALNSIVGNWMNVQDLIFLDPGYESGQPLEFDSLCVDMSYDAPPGTNLSLFRYVGVGNDDCSNPASGDSPVTVGWAIVRPDRIRYDYDLLGNLVSVTDAAGNQTRYEYELGGLGRIKQIYSNRCIPGGGAAACPRFDFDYGTFQMPATPAVGAPLVTRNTVTVTDPARRKTTYVVSQDLLKPQLLQVWNPDNPITDEPGQRPSVEYTYSTLTEPCAASAPNVITTGSLCSATDAAGNVTRFAYTPAPAGPDRVLSVKDRRGTVGDAENEDANGTGLRTVYTYVQGATEDTDFVLADMASPAKFGTADPPTGCIGQALCQRNAYLNIDHRGRVGQIARGDASGASGSYVKQEAFFWDGTAQFPTCQYPVSSLNAGVDNNLCRTISRATPSSAPMTPTTVASGDAASDYTYGPMGELVREATLTEANGTWPAQLTAENSAVTTYGTHSQFFDANGNVRSYDTYVRGNNDIRADATGLGYPRTVQQDNPVGYWRMNETNGTVMANEAPGGADGFYVSSGNLDKPGPWPGNRSVQEGANDYAAGIWSLGGFVSGTGASSRFTVEGWVNTTNTNPEVMFSYGPSANQNMTVGRMAGGVPAVILYSNAFAGQAIVVRGQYTVADGDWHHVVASYDGSGTASGVRIYVDGVTQPTVIDADTLAGPFATPGSPAAFGYQTVPAGPTNARMDEVAVYSDVLSLARIRSHHRAGFGGDPIEANTLFSVTDRTQMLTPRGNATPANWGDYLTAYERDVPPDGEDVSLHQVVAGQPVCGSDGSASGQGNTGLLCAVHTPAANGVPNGDCASPIALAPGADAPSTPSYRHACESYDYDQFGQRTKLRTKKAHSTGSNAATTFTYYQDTPQCGTAAERKNCDLTGTISAGGWLKAVTDPAGESVVYAYDQAGNTARTWDRNATTGKPLDGDWTNPNNPPSQLFSEANYATPVTSASLAPSLYGTLIVQPDGTLKGSGDNAQGELGDGTATPRPTPVTTTMLENVVQVAQSATGGFMQCRLSAALTGNGDVHVWGANKLEPEKLPISNIISIAVGGCHIAALDDRGNVWAYGANSAGQVGNGTTSPLVASPVKVLSGVATIAAGDGHTLAVKTDGSLWAWGANNFGQLGDGTTTNRSTPTKVTSIVDLASITAGVGTSFAVKKDGTVWAWGYAGNHALGTGSATDTSTPTRITALGAGTDAGRVRQLVGAVWGGAALMTDGDVYTWGYNNFGQIGDGTTTTRPTPVEVPGLADQIAIGGGWATWTTANAAGRVSMWGYTGSHQLGNGTAPVSTPTPVQTTGYTISPYSSPWRYLRAGRAPMGNRATYQVDQLGNVRASRTPRGHDVHTSAFDSTARFDQNNAWTSATAPQQRDGEKSATATYDPFGNLVRSTDPIGNATFASFDSANRPLFTLSTRDTDANSTGSGCAGTASSGGVFGGWAPGQIGHKICTNSTTYDGLDRTKTITNTHGHTISYTYDNAGRQIAQTVPRNYLTHTTLTTRWNYDADGNVTDQCPPRQFDPSEPNSTSNNRAGCTGTGRYSGHWAYDRAGLPTSQSSYRGHSLHTTRFGYDADGNQTSVTDANNHETTYTYDLQGRRLTMQTPRSETVRHTTRYTYDPAGNITAIQAPGSRNLGSGAGGDLVVDGATNSRSNPFRIPAGAQYRNVTLTNGGWISAAGPVGSRQGLDFSATGTVTVCATCGIDQKGNGLTGGPGGNGLLGGFGGPGQNDAADGNGGRAGAPGLVNLIPGGGGGGGHNGPGAPGVTLDLGGAGGAGGLASGSSDFALTGTDYKQAVGGGGGGGAQAILNVPGGNGGNGGGFVHITADTIVVNGTIDASGAPGGNAIGSSAAGGGGAGGGIWLSAQDVELATSAVLDVTGGPRGTADNGAHGGAGAPGYLRIDSDNSTNAPTGATRRKAANITAYSYDANHQLIDTLLGAQTLQADPAKDDSNQALPGDNGHFNTRTRNIYDADGNIVSVIPPQSFTNKASLTNPDTDSAARIDYDLNGSQAAVYAPRYDTSRPGKDDIATGAGGDAGTGTNQQRTECPTAATTGGPGNPASYRPTAAEGLPGFASTVGVCRTWSTYDANNRLARQYLATSEFKDPDGNDNRYTATTYTDDGLVRTITAPDPSATSGRVTTQTWYDGVGRPIKTQNALGNATTTSYTQDGLVAQTKAQSYAVGAGQITHKTIYTYNANGQESIVFHPNAFTNDADDVVDNGLYTTTYGYTSDGLVESVRAPGLGDGGGRTGDQRYNITSYTYDSVGNPITTKSPSANATGGGDNTNPWGKPTVNTFTHDNLIATTSNPITDNSYRTTRYAYTPAGQKSVVQVARCASGTAANCEPGNPAWNPGTTTRFTYAPNGLNIDQIGSNQRSITTSYDQAGRLKEVIDPLSGIKIKASYYLDGLTREVADGTNTNTYAYTGAGQPSLRTDLTGAAGVTGGTLKRTSYAYNQASLPTQMTSDVPTGVGAAGNTTTWAYNKLGQTTEIKDTGGAGAGQTTTVGYYPDDTPSFVASNHEVGTALGRYVYSYDNGGRVTSKIMSLPGGATPTHTFGYNPASNVTSFTGGTKNTTYVWDRNGNRRSATTPAAPASATVWDYNADNTIKSQTSATTGGPTTTRTYDYNNAGLLRNDGCTTYEYDDFDRTKSVQAVDPGTDQSQLDKCGPRTGTSGSTTTYTYDGLDRQRTLTVAGGNDPAGAKGNPNGTTTNAYDGLTSTIIGQTGALNSNNGRADTLYQLDPAGRQVALTQAGGGTSYLLQDGQGNTGVLQTTAGATACVATYDPFGSPQLPAGNENSVCASGTQAAATANTVWYRGESRDASTGNYQLGTRTYNPQTASFTTPDYYRVSTPDRDLGVGTDPLTANTYTYVNGNPVNLSDPTGHFSLDWLENAVRGLQKATCGGLNKDECRQLGEDDVAAAEESLSAAEDAEFDYAHHVGNLLKDVSGLTDALDCYNNPGFNSACISTAVSLFGFSFSMVGKVKKIYSAFDNIRDSKRAFDAAKSANIASATNRLADSKAFLTNFDDHWSSVQRLRRSGNAADNASDASRAKSVRNQGGPGRSCRHNSFSGDTLVLMADGTKKPIRDLKPGDRVIATDPESGKQRARRVTHVWVHQDTLVDLRIDGETLTTTEDHPFWNATDHAWQDAQDLDPGDQVLTAHDELVYVQGLVSGTEHPDTAYNLTVHGLHTYHVGHTTTLVHNTRVGCGTEDAGDAAANSGGLIRYNSDELSSAAHNARGASGVGPGRNVAAARVDGLDEPIIGFSQGGGYHAEQHVLDQLEARGIDPLRVTGMYSDRQPCPVCGQTLSGALSPGTPVTWAVPWGTNATINAASNRLLARFTRGAT